MMMINEAHPTSLILTRCFISYRNIHFISYDIFARLEAYYYRSKSMDKKKTSVSGGGKHGEKKEGNFLTKTAQSIRDKVQGLTDEVKEKTQNLKHGSESKKTKKNKDNANAGAASRIPAQGMNTGGRDDSDDSDDENDSRESGNTLFSSNGDYLIEKYFSFKETEPTSKPPTAARRKSSGTQAGKKLFNMSLRYMII